MRCCCWFCSREDSEGFADGSGRVGGAKATTIIDSNNNKAHVSNSLQLVAHLYHDQKGLIFFHARNTRSNAGTFIIELCQQRNLFWNPFLIGVLYLFNEVDDQVLNKQPQQVLAKNHPIYTLYLAGAIFCKLDWLADFADDGSHLWWQFFGELCQGKLQFHFPRNIKSCLRRPIRDFFSVYIYSHPSNLAGLPHSLPAIHISPDYLWHKRPRRISIRMKLCESLYCHFFRRIFSYVGQDYVGKGGCAQIFGQTISNQGLFCETKWLEWLS